MKWLVGLMGAVMLTLTYGEHAFSSPEVRPVAHYFADGAHIAWLYAIVGACAALGMRRCWERLALVGICAAGAAEGLMTAIAGLIGDPRVIPSQWSGWLGEMVRLPLAAIGLSAACVLACWVWSSHE